MSFTSDLFCAVSKVRVRLKESEKDSSVPSAERDPDNLGKSTEGTVQNTESAGDGVYGDSISGEVSHNNDDSGYESVSYIEKQGDEPKKAGLEESHSERGNRESQRSVIVENPKALERAEEFLRDIFRIMNMEADVRHDFKEELGYVLSIEGKALGILIGKHGQTLDAMQYLTNLAANHGIKEGRARFILDVEDYRSRREETLQALAHRLADRALHLHREVRLEPMNRHERKIIHMALQDNYRVSTYSDGDEPHRCVVITPSRRRRV